MTKESFLQVIKSTCVYPQGYEPEFLYWYPFSKIKETIPLVVYDLDHIYEDGKIIQLERVLNALSIDKVISVQNQDYKPEPERLDLIARLYETDESGYNFNWYVENYYYDETKEWLIYVSHEGTITFAGKRLVQAATENIDAQYRAQDEHE